jgi:LruC domain-containing protein
MRAKLFISLSFVLLIACKKEDSILNTKATRSYAIDSMTGLNVSEEFNWSASFKSELQVSFSNPHNLSVEEELVYINDSEGKTLAKTAVKNGVANFKVQLPSNKQYFLSLPFTGHQQALTMQKQQNFDLSQTTVGKASPRFNKTAISSCTICETPLTNSLAELPVIPLGGQTIVSANTVPGWETTASDNKIAISSTGFLGVPAQEGNQFFEINADRASALYQELCLEPGSTIRWSAWHRGRAGVDEAIVRIGASLASAAAQQTMRTGNSAWKYYHGTYVVPANEATTFFIFDASTTAGSNFVGNFLDNFRISCDTDGDGVVDADDDYPADPSRAYQSFFPSAGKQIVAFEDLWPYIGDYDFNDLTLSNQVEISHNADNELVDAQFTVSIDAIGAGVANGIGLMLRDNSKASLASGSIASVSGDVSLDPNDASGLILTNDVFANLSSKYQNNGIGPSKVPDTLRFTLNFNPSAGSELLPELYIFRTNDRSLEIHRSGFAGTASFDANRLNTGDDNGDFKAADGLPWAIEIISASDFQHPLERINIVTAFPLFADWASSGGNENTTWYLTPTAGNVFN